MPRRYHIRGATAKDIAESIELAIEAGRLRPEDRLPTIRALASELAVSPTTVNAAFALLRRHGRISGNRRGGSSIVGRPAYQSAQAAGPPAGLRNLAEANPDPALLPPLRAAVSAAVTENVLYGNNGADPALVALARRRMASEGIDAAQIAVVSGALDGVERALAAHLVAGDALALEDPTYPPYRELARVMGLRVVPVALDDDGILPEALAAALRARAKALIVVPRAQNPTGAAFTPARIRALRRVLATEPRTLVIEDDYSSAVSGIALHSLASGNQHWAHIRSVAKFLGPDLRVALVAGDGLTISRLSDRQRITSGWVSSILQGTVARVWSDRAVVRRLASAAALYRERRTALIEALARHGIGVTGKSGFNVWIPLAQETGAVRALQAAGWAVDAGERYRIASGPGIRVTITTLEAPQAERFAATLASALAPRYNRIAP